MPAEEKLLRPYGVVLDGHLELGLEVVLYDGTIQEIRPHTGIPDDYILSPAFVNAHSHFEYRGMLGLVQAPDFPGWLREISRLKELETPQQVAQACELAGKENRQTGIAVVGEHNDRPGSADALVKASIDGWIYQEVITIGNQANRSEKLEMLAGRAEAARRIFGDRVSLSPHAPYTVDSETLGWLGGQDAPLSIHIAETTAEKALFERGEGPLMEIFMRFGMPLPETGRRLIDCLEAWGYLKSNRQFVHACDLDDQDLHQLASAGVKIAHCPRSNRALGCPPAKVRRMLEAGLEVGIGLDSVASSGEIDMFAEMRAALDVSQDCGELIAPEDVWRMATTMGYRTIGRSTVKGATAGIAKSDGIGETWGIEVGSKIPLVGVRIDGAYTVREVIEQATPQNVEWVL